MLEHLGMPNFGNKLKPEELENIKKFIAASAKALREKELKK
jgi:hypothetical protein